jgi:hypothetical protein
MPSAERREREPSAPLTGSEAMRCSLIDEMRLGALDDNARRSSRAPQAMREAAAHPSMAHLGARW